MEDMAKDRRVEYLNDKYPFLVSVHRYTVPSQQPSEYDFANIRVPQGDDPEDYIVYWVILAHNLFAANFNCVVIIVLARLS